MEMAPDILKPPRSSTHTAPTQKHMHMKIENIYATEGILNWDKKNITGLKYLPILSRIENSFQIADVALISLMKSALAARLYLY